MQVQGGVAQRGQDLGAVAGVGAVPVLIEGHVAHPVDRVLDAPVLAQPGGDRGGSGVFERQAADGVDDFDRTVAGGGDDAFAGDPDELLGVGEADSPCGSEDLQRASLDAAVSSGVVGRLRTVTWFHGAR